MMKKLDKKQIDLLKQQHRSEKSRDICDRIKAVVWSNEGWTEEQIAKAFCAHRYCEEAS